MATVVHAPARPAQDAPGPAAKLLRIQLDEVATGFEQPTDLHSVPGQPDLMVVLQKNGQAHWFSLSDPKRRGQWLDLRVPTASEQGLLGIAFDPKFTDNGLLYLNMTVPDGSREATEVASFRADPKAFPRRGPTRVRALLRVRQPYQNHNAGQLQFGPDGYLYIGLGDGGYANDPHGHGQNPDTLLGSMLRIDVHAGNEQRPYGIPADNPFVGRPGFKPEIFAYGLRNPWRFSFAPDGRLVVADVGQNQWEEVDIVRAGDNLGWNIREGLHCFEDNPRCKDASLVAPIHEYGRALGQSVTGGYVYTGKRLSGLSGRYVFGDFASGRLWAIPLPKDRARTVKALDLGRFPIAPVAFAVGDDGELYVADFRRGGIHRLSPTHE